MKGCSSLVEMTDEDLVISMGASGHGGYEMDV